MFLKFFSLSFRYNVAGCVVTKMWNSPLGHVCLEWVRRASRPRQALQVDITFLQCIQMCPKKCSSASKRRKNVCLANTLVRWEYGHLCALWSGSHESKMSPANLIVSCLSISSYMFGDGYSHIIIRLESGSSRFCWVVNSDLLWGGESGTGQHVYHWVIWKQLRYEIVYVYVGPSISH